MPVLMVSGDDQATVQDRALAEGASAFLRKPLALPLLVNAVERHASGSMERRMGNGSGGAGCVT